jgi:hypothetical protein
VTLALAPRAGVLREGGLQARPCSRRELRQDRLDDSVASPDRQPRDLLSDRRAAALEERDGTFGQDAIVSVTDRRRL